MKKVVLSVLLMSASCSVVAMSSLHGLLATLVGGSQVVLRAQRGTAMKNVAKALTKFEEAAGSPALKDGRGGVFQKRVEAYQDKFKNNKSKYLLYREVLYGGGSLATFFAMMHCGMPVDAAYLAEWGYISLLAGAGMTGVDGAILNHRQIKKLTEIEEKIQGRMKELLGDIDTRKIDMTFGDKE